MKSDSEKAFSIRQSKQRLCFRNNARVGLWHLMVIPFLVLIKRYILLRGFRDGIAGWILAFEGMAGPFDAYAMAWDKQNRIARKDLESSFHSLEN